MTVAGRKLRRVSSSECTIRVLIRLISQIWILILNNLRRLSLRLLDAIENGYDTTKAFRDELNGYRNQLAQSYLTDPI